MQDLDTSKAEIVTNSAYAAGQAVPARWRPGYVFSAKTQPGGSLVATACSDGVLRVWDLRSQQLHTVCSLPLHDGMAAACAWDAHGHCLSSIATNGSITAMVNSRCCNVNLPGRHSAHFLMLCEQAVGCVLHGTAARLTCQCQCKLHSALLLSHHEKATSSLHVCEWLCLHQDMRTQHAIWCGTASCGLRDCCYLPNNMDKVNCLVAAGTDGALHVCHHSENQGIAHHRTPTIRKCCCHEHALTSIVMHRKESFCCLHLQVVAEDPGC